MSQNQKSVETRLSAFKLTPHFVEDMDGILKKFASFIGEYIEDINIVRSKDIASESKCQYSDPIASTRYVLYEIELSLANGRYVVVKTFSLNHITQGSLLKEYATFKFNIQKSASDTQIDGKPNLYLYDKTDFIGDQFVEFDDIYYYKNVWFVRRLEEGLLRDALEKEKKLDMDEEWKSNFDPKLRKKRLKRLNEIEKEKKERQKVLDKEKKEKIQRQMRIVKEQERIKKIQIVREKIRLRKKHQHNFDDYTTYKFCSIM
jgi:hypothetical protein